MAGLPLQPSPEATPPKPDRDFGALGRSQKRAILLIMLGSAVALGLAWLLGYAKFD